jgi:NADPH2:quinone reductase
VALLRGAAVSPDELLVLTRAALAEAAAGRVKPVIGQTFPLAQAARRTLLWSRVRPLARACW